MSNNPRKDVLVSGPVSNFILGACKPDSDASDVLVNVNGSYYFDDYRTVDPVDIVILQASIFPDGPVVPDNTKVWFQIISGDELQNAFLNWSIDGNLLTFSSISEQDAAGSPPTMDLDDTGMPTDGKVIYAWVDMLFGMGSDRQINIGGSNTSGYQLVPLPLGWTVPELGSIEFASIFDAVQYQYNWRNAVLNNDKITQRSLELSRGVTTFRCNLGTKEPYYTTTLCGEAWNTTYPNSIGQQIKLNAGEGFAIPDDINMFCSDISLKSYTEISGTDLRKLIAWDYMSNHEYIVKEFIQNSATIKSWILDNLFTLFPGICDYVTSGNRCKSEVCGKCKDSYCTDSFNGYCNDKVQWWVIVIMCVLGVMLLVVVVFAIWAFMSRNKALNQINTYQKAASVNS